MLGRDDRKGNKLILIADAKQPTRYLMQETVTYSGTISFSPSSPMPPSLRCQRATGRDRHSQSQDFHFQGDHVSPKGGGLGVANQKR